MKSEMTGKATRRLISAVGLALRDIRLIADSISALIYQFNEDPMKVMIPPTTDADIPVGFDVAGVDVRSVCG